MALINCPECGKQISDKAKNCIHCGYPLDFADSESTPIIVENTGENSDKIEHDNISPENKSQTTTSINKEFNFKDFIKKHKRIIITSVISVLAMAVLVLFLLKPEPSFEENLVGTWTSSKNSSSGKSSITFSYENDVLSGELAYYDYDESEWNKLSFEVDKYTDYTMTLLFEGGKIDKFSYSIGKDKLIFDGVIYTNEDKNIKVKETNKTYILDGVPMPVRRNIYFGMKSSEIKEFADSDFGHKTNYVSGNGECHFYGLPDLFYPQVDGFTTYDFNNNDEMYKMKYLFYDSGNYSEINALKNNIIDAYSEQFGDYETRQWTSVADYTDYIWKSGNLIVTFCDQTREDNDVAYTIEYALSNVSN